MQNYTIAGTRRSFSIERRIRSTFKISTGVGSSFVIACQLKRYPQTQTISPVGRDSHPSFHFLIGVTVGRLFVQMLHTSSYETVARYRKVVQKKRREHKMSKEDRTLEELKKIRELLTPKPDRSIDRKD